MDEPIFDEFENDLVRFFARQFLKGHTKVSWHEFSGFGKDEAQITTAINRLLSARLIKNIKGLPEKTIQIDAACVQLVRQWDNAPPEPLPDYRDKLSKWFWSKPWSIGVYVVVIGLPAALGYVVMVKTIVEWLGKGSK